MDDIVVVLIGVVIVVGLTLIGWVVYRRLHQQPTVTYKPLLGGDATQVTNNQGVNSYCIVDDDKFTKYYFKVDDPRLYNTPIWYVVDKSKFRLKRLNELDMLRYVNEHITPSPCPKVYPESGNVEFDEKIFNSIRSHGWYEPEKVQMKKLVMERVKGVTFQQYLIDRGLKVNVEKRTIDGNDVPKETMVAMYRKWWELLLRFFDEDIVPDDLDNMSNVIVVEDSKADDGFKLVALDCSFWLIAIDRPVHVLNEDLLYHYFWGLYWRHRRKTLDIIYALKAHSDWESILKDSLDGLVPTSMYQRLRDDFIGKDHEYVRMKQQVLMQLCDESSMRSVGSFKLFDLYVSDEKEYNKLVTEANEVLKSLPEDISETFDVAPMHKSWDYIYDSALNEAGKAWVFLHAKQYSGNTPDKILCNVRYLIECIEMVNDPLTLYPIGKSKCMYTRKANDNKPITTTKYLPLIKSNEGCTVKSTFIGDTEVDSKYFYDGFFVVDVEVKDTIYVVLEP